MPSDLERFLQQAAERLKQKMEQGNAPSPTRPAQPIRPAPVRQAERAPPQFEPEIIDAEVIDLSRRELGPDPLSNIDTRPELAREINQADEKMSGHLHDVFDHSVSNLHSASAALSTNTGKGSELTIRKRQVSPLVDMLRQPESLRAAFIASEIFTRKF
ncbi:MAG: hypothetical protein R3C53_19865 [Pirellulaceae bacterium]